MCPSPNRKVRNNNKILHSILAINTFLCLGMITGVYINDNHVVKSGVKGYVRSIGYIDDNKKENIANNKTVLSKNLQYYVEIASLKENNNGTITVDLDKCYLPKNKLHLYTIGRNYTINDCEYDSKNMETPDSHIAKELKTLKIKDNSSSGKDMKNLSKNFDDIVTVESQ